MSSGSDISAPGEPIRSNSWERQRGESVLWFGRFELYLRLGWKRSLYGACIKEWELLSIGLEAVEAAKPPKRPTGTPGAWRVAAEKFHWVERAEAWDKYRADAVEKNVRAAWEELSFSLLNAVQVLNTVMASGDEEQKRLAATSVLQRAFTLWGGGDSADKPKEIQFVEFA